MRTALVVAVLLLLLLCVLPVVRVLAYSFLSDDGGLTFENYRAAFAPPYRLGVLLHSLSLASLATLLALLIGVPYAFFCTRVRVPGRGLFAALYILPLVLPPLLMTMGWTQFLSARYGPSAEGLLGGVKGAAFLFALSYWPFVVLFARKGFTEIGAGLEEAARVTCGPFRAFFRITLRLAAPGILAGALFVFLFSLSDFSVVDYLSTIFPPKERVTAYTFEAFSAWATNWVQRAGPREATALCVPVGVASLLLLLLIFRLHGRTRLLSVTSGHVRARDVEELSPPAVRWTVRVSGLLFLTAVLVLSVGIPLGRTIRDAAGRDGLLESVRFALVPGDGGSVGALPDVLNSLFFSALAAAGMTILALVLARHAVRHGPRREALILSLAFLPLAFGSILYGVGLIRTWNHPWLEIDRVNPVYDTFVIVVLMLIGKYLPFAFAAVMTSLRRIDPRFEEAGAVCGARPFRRASALALPLARGGLAGGFILGFVFSMRELDTIVLISAGNRTAMMKIYTWVHTAYESSVAALSLVLVALIALPFLLHWLVAARRVRVL
ncbi:MAG: ABC transporter permease subunit [Planctomycetes bacterium]|jgi:iron(III) transport system permease protein|nr:ABC transporter permease subunit [Planctomycetota bacterium]